jgi:hypothetical protein
MTRGGATFVQREVMPAWNGICGGEFPRVDRKWPSWDLRRESQGLRMRRDE